MAACTACFAKGTRQPSREHETAIRRGQRLHPEKKPGDCSERTKGERHMWCLHLTPAQNCNSERVCCTLAMSRHVWDPSFPWSLTQFSLSYIQLPVQSWQTQSWHLLPYAPALVGRVSPTHRDTESSCTHTSEQKQRRRTSFCSFTWKKLCYLMGAVPERCQVRSS